MYDRILLPTDGSDGTDRAIEHALAAADADTTIHVLSVVDRRLYLSAEKDDQEEVLETLRAESDQAVTDLAARIEDAGHDAVGVVREGIPHDEIVAYADEAEVDLIVIGSHGRTGREKIVNLGSVTERVISNVGRPVLVVDIGPEDASRLEATVAAEADGGGKGESA
jgi:nucleotide-binding universal stress UspA family protein